MNDTFSNGIKLPPVHPNCRCAVAFEEVAEPVAPTVNEVYGANVNTTGNQLINSQPSGIINMGDGDVFVTVASGAIPRTDLDRMDEHAKRYYEEIRKRKSDVVAIAQNTGFSVEDIDKIKRHVFFNAYALDGKGARRFDPSYDMAVSWQRLIDGKNIQEMDIVMLHHELLEHKIMTEQDMPYHLAHKQANKQYNYQAYCDELDRKGGLR